jgi:hypothetical protein
LSALEEYALAAAKFEVARPPQLDGVDELIGRICKEPWQTPEERNGANSLVLRLWLLKARRQEACRT